MAKENLDNIAFASKNKSKLVMCSFWPGKAIGVGAGGMSTILCCTCSLLTAVLNVICATDFLFRYLCNTFIVRSFVL